MTGQQLKNSILQMAIQGKLVPQDPHDEPASVLLERIREEKKRLVKEGKISLSKPEKSVKNNLIEEYEIPETWAWAQINDICRVFGRIGFRGYTKSDLVGKNQGAISISPSNMKDNKMDYSECTYISWNKYEESPEIKIFNGDILIVKTGSSYGKTVIVKNLTEKATINPQIAVIKNIKIDSDFLKYYLQSPFAQSHFREFVLGTSIPTFSQLNLISMVCPLPPLAEQRRIVEKLETLMPLIERYGKSQEALDRLNAALPDQLRQSILQEAIQGRLVPQDPNEEPASALLERIRREKARLVKEGKLKKKDLEEKPISPDEIPFELPEGWVWCRLGDMFNIVSARRVHQKDWRTSGIPFYRTREIGWLADKKDVRTELFIDVSLYEEFKKSGYPSENDIMMTAVGTVGKTYIVKSTDKFYYKDASVLCLENVGKIDPHYVCHVIQSPFFRAMIAEGAGGTTVDTITIIRANDYLFPLPPLAEQRRIVTKLEELLHEIDKLKG